MTDERVVLDTNTMVCGLLSSGTMSAAAIDRAVSRGQLVATAAILRDLMRVLVSPKLDRYVPLERREALLLALAPLVDIVAVLRPVPASRHLNDDMFREAAVNGRADALVTTDRDLLELNPLHGIAVLTPGDYVNWQAVRR
jgi:uncharacterized protein